MRRVSKPAISLIPMNKLKSYLLSHLIIIYTRYLLGGSLVFASMIKIKGRRFTTESGLDAPFGSVFHFFETMYQTGIYWQFIGICQMIAGFLLLTQRFSKLGAIITFPITLNMFMITLSIEGFSYTPVVTGMMLFANLLLIFWDWDQLKVLFNLNPKPMNPGQYDHNTTWWVTGLFIFIFTFTYRLMYDFYDPILWGAVCGGIGLIGLVIGLKKIKFRHL